MASVVLISLKKIFSRSLCEDGLDAKWKEDQKKEDFN